MPRKLRSGKKQPTQRKFSRNEIILYVVGVIVALSMVLGTIATALSR